jgi:hypothetical protein
METEGGLHDRWANAQNISRILIERYARISSTEAWHLPLPRKNLTRCRDQLATTLASDRSWKRRSFYLPSVNPTGVSSLGGHAFISTEPASVNFSTLADGSSSSTFRACRLIVARGTPRLVPLTATLSAWTTSIFVPKHNTSELRYDGGTLYSPGAALL